MGVLAPEAIEERIHLVGMVEGVSFLVLLFGAMPLKYLGGVPQAVSFVGMAHGALFILYAGVLLQAWSKQKWPFRIGFLGFLSAVLPFGPWIFQSRVLARKDPA